MVYGICKGWNGGACVLVRNFREILEVKILGGRERDNSAVPTRGKYVLGVQRRRYLP